MHDSIYCCSSALGSGRKDSSQLRPDKIKYTEEAVGMRRERIKEKYSKQHVGVLAVQDRLYSAVCV